MFQHNAQCSSTRRARRAGAMQSDAERCRAMPDDAGRCRTMQGDAATKEEVKGKGKREDGRSAESCDLRRALGGDVAPDAHRRRHANVVE